MKIKRRTLTTAIRWIVRISITSGIIALFYCYFLTNIFTITSYDISGVDEDARAAIITQLHILDKQKAYKVFPLDKIFTYSNSVITNTIRERVPEMATVSMRPVGLHMVKIEVTLLKPLFRASDTQAVNEDGIIFNTKYSIHIYPLITIASSTTEIVKNSGLPFTRMALPHDDEFDKSRDKEFLLELSSLATKISSIVFSVDSIQIESTGDITFLNASGTSKVVVLKNSDYKKAWSTLVSAIDTDPLKTKLEVNRGGLEYLDVRYGNKVFYRFNDMAFQNGTVTGILDHHATSTQEVTSSTSSRQ